MSSRPGQSQSWEQWALCEEERAQLSHCQPTASVVMPALTNPPRPWEPGPHVSSPFEMLAVNSQDRKKQLVSQTKHVWPASAHRATRGQPPVRAWGSELLRLSVRFPSPSCRPGPAVQRLCQQQPPGLRQDLPQEQPHGGRGHLPRSKCAAGAARRGPSPPRRRPRPPRGGALREGRGHVSDHTPPPRA